MARILSGNEVVKALNAQILAKAAQHEVSATLAIVRVGERDDDISYERGAMRRCATLDIEVKNVLLPAEVDQQTIENAIRELNADSSVHGILLLRPLPRHLDEAAICALLDPAKDVDGITDGSLAGVFTGSGIGYPPCTASACLEILDHFDIPLQGKNIVVIGRSLVVGKPVGIMLMGRHATVTTCHTRSINTAEIAQRAEIIIAAAGVVNLVDGSYLAPGQIVIDVGIHVDAEGKLCGDVLFSEAAEIVDAITPVPGGVGTVTTSVLCAHVVDAACKAAARKM